jgi:hypothetical protein
MWPGAGVGVGVGVTVAGVELNNNTALKHEANEDGKDDKSCKKIWRTGVVVGVTVAGVELNNNTALTTRSERRVRRRQFRRIFGRKQSRK